VRASLGSELLDSRPAIVEAFQALRKKAHPNLYVAISAECRKKKSFVVHSKATTVQEDSTAGVVFRVYDGQSLFEVARPGFHRDTLMSAVDEVIAKQKTLGAIPSSALTLPTWDERTKDLHPEILTQIPSHAVPGKDWLHFGIPVQTDFSDDTEIMTWLKALYDGVTKRPLFEQLKVDFCQATLRSETHDLLFIDESVRLSQALPRKLLRVIASKGEESGREDRGGLGGKEVLGNLGDFGQRCLENLQAVLKADKLSPGRYKLLMGPAITGVFAHEAFGHSQEGDTWVRGRSKAKELFETNTKVGNANATIVNNPALYKNGLDPHVAWGSYYFDEEGWFAREQTLVDKGYLCSPMTSFLSQARLKSVRSANGKREDWRRAVYTRQTNTYFTPGDRTLAELLKLTGDGFLAEECAGGMEDPKGMGIQVGVQYLKEIKNGQLTGRTFKGPSGGSVQMTGAVEEYLSAIEAKGHVDITGRDTDLREPWNDVGGCAKYHKEFVYAGCGGPYMLVKDVLLG
jgi:hypothetical protein